MRDFFYIKRAEKKNGCHHDNQSSVNLKSNTMKNTVQMYGDISYLASFHGKNLLIFSEFNIYRPTKCQFVYTC